jgi:hypothetical protein
MFLAIILAKGKNYWTAAVVVVYYWLYFFVCYPSNFFVCCIILLLCFCHYIMDKITKLLKCRYLFQKIMVIIVIRNIACKTDFSLLIYYCFFNNLQFLNIYYVKCNVVLLVAFVFFGKHYYISLGKNGQHFLLLLLISSLQYVRDQIGVFFYFHQI